MGRLTIESLALVAAIGLAGSAMAELSAREVAIAAEVDGKQAEMTRTLSAWVELNTGSWNRAGLERFADLLGPLLQELGFAVEIEPGPRLDLPGIDDARTGPLLVARRAQLRGTGEPIELLLSGHYDTVFEPDSPFARFTREDAERATGPGVTDMKGGLVVMLYALRALASRGELDGASWTIVLNADEEIGSLGSRAAIERAARRADYGFVFEAAHRGGGMVRSRRGLGQFHMTVDGVAAHSGSSHEKGRSAVRELADKILLVERLTDYERGVTLNVGTVSGGTKRNIVPSHAEAWIDLRYDHPQLGEETRRELDRIADRVGVDGTRTTLWGTLHRPPKVATEGVVELLEVHAHVAGDMGIELPEPVHAGGGTDGSLMGAVGLATLDSLGVVGGAAHTEREFVNLASLPERAALAAILLSRLIRAGPPAREATTAD